MAYSSLERRRRAIARFALYTSLSVVIVVTMTTLWLIGRPKDLGVEVSWAEVPWHHLPAVRLLQQYLRIDSTTQVGDEYAAALFLAGPLEAAGLDVTIERLGERQANLWAVLEGDDPDAIVLHSHLDTEPILALENWEFEPFSGILDPPWIYGRGSFDMKSYTIAQLMAVLALAAEQPRPARTVILLATSSEERGSDIGTRWLLREHPELVSRFWGVITEGGIVEAVNLAEPIKYWGIELVQKRFVEVIACASSRERLEALREDVKQTGLPVTELLVTEEVRDYWEVYAPTRGADFIRRLLRDPDALVHDPHAFEQLPAYLRSQLRNEVVPFAVEPAEDGGFALRLMVHLLPGTDLEETLGRLLPDWVTDGVTVQVIDRPSASGGSPRDHPLFEAVQAEISAAYPGQPVGPLFLPWTATDARFFRLAGIPTYGFSPFFILTPDTLNIGLANEKIALPGFDRGVSLYRRVLERVVGSRAHRSVD